MSGSLFFFFFSSRRRHTRSDRDWSSDVCSSDLAPLDEPALRRLMKTLDRLGDRAGALEAYEPLANRLTAELEADPAPETRALAGAVRERVATLSSDAELPPEATAPEPPKLASDSRHRLRWLGAATAVLGVAVVL